MKEILTVSCNFLASYTENKKLLPQAEVILVLSEPTYTVDACGELVRQRENTHVRFSASPKALRKLSKELECMADESDSLIKGNPEKESNA